MWRGRTNKNSGTGPKNNRRPKNKGGLNKYIGEGKMRWVTNQGKNQTQMQIVYPSNVKSQHISSNCQVPNADAIVFENRLFYALSSAVGQTLI